MFFFWVKQTSDPFWPRKKTFIPNWKRPLTPNYGGFLFEKKKPPQSNKFPLGQKVYGGHKILSYVIGGKKKNFLVFKFAWGKCPRLLCPFKKPPRGVGGPFSLTSRVHKQTVLFGKSPKHFFEAARPPSLNFEARVKGTPRPLYCPSFFHPISFVRGQKFISARDRALFDGVWAGP